MAANIDWVALAKARDLNIPEDAVTRIAPGLTSLHAAFAPLLEQLPYTVEPSIILSEQAVLGE